MHLIYSVYSILILALLLFLLIKKVIFYETPPFPIDVVYTWKGEKVTNNIRTSNNNELKYSLRSIDVCAPWVNKIYILMNNPKKYPTWIKKNNKIIVVDHTETFPSKKYLPNTNSNAIETTIVNIKGLSEHYIYFNDDVFLGRKTNYTDFFTPDGKALIDKYAVESNDILKDPRYNLLDIEYPSTVNMLHTHVPITQIKSLVKEFNEKYADFIEWIRMTKTRNMRGYDICHRYGLNTPCQQIHYPIAKYMYLKEKAEYKENDSEDIVQYIHSGSAKFSESLHKALMERPLLFCVNDTETDPAKRPEAQQKLLDFFNAYYPNKASFEK